MSDTTVEQRARKMFLTEQEFAISSRIRSRFIDAKIVYSRIPAARASIRPIDATNAVRSSFGSGTQTDSLFNVFIQPHSDYDSPPTIFIPFGSRFAALILWQRAMLQRLGSCSDHTLDRQIALNQPSIWKSSTLDLS